MEPLCVSVQMYSGKYSPSTCGSFPVALSNWFSLFPSLLLSCWGRWIKANTFNITLLATYQTVACVCAFGERQRIRTSEKCSISRFDELRSSRFGRRTVKSRGRPACWNELLPLLFLTLISWFPAWTLRNNLVACFLQNRQSRQSFYFSPAESLLTPLISFCAPTVLSDMLLSFLALHWITYRLAALRIA